MVRVEVIRDIAVAPQAVLDLVMDVERYAEVDDKIRPVLWSRRDGDRVEFACRPRLIGLRQPKVVQYMVLTPDRRIDIGLLPRPQNRLAHLVATFHASFDCEAIADGTRLTRTLQFEFTPVFRPLLEPLFRRRLPAEVHDEVNQAKRYLEDGDTHV